MNQLIPCPDCSRHVRQAEARCPFCNAALSLAHVPAHPLPRTRMGRAATFAFGATLVGATTLVACGGESEEGKKGGGAGAAGSTSKAGAGAGGSSAGTQSVGGTGIGPVYGAPAGGTGTDGGGSTAAGTSSGGSGGPAPLYGAPAAGFSGIPLYGAAPAD
jgi:hypothetical protein